MKKILLVTMILSTVFLSACSTKSDDIRIGWQSAWATQAQLALVLQNTDILKDHKITAKFLPFNYGAPMAEAAVAGDLDMAFVGDQPAVSIMARNSDWIPIARLMNFRVAILGPKGTNRMDLADRDHIKLAIPFGSSAHRESLKYLQELGLNTDSIKTVNIDITEQGEIIRSGKWKDISAFSSWDPHIAIYEKDELASILVDGMALGVIMAKKSFVEEHPDVIDQFKSAFGDAYWFYKRNTHTVNQWYIDYANLKLDESILDRVADFEPNMIVGSRSEISVELSNKDIDQLQFAADFALNQGLIKKPISIRNR
ncbi:ABC transporter substrate-binding protein [Nitrosomonas sp.]|uniref:ABC transporter substrate-binding protein n=1 Tax=Nitrosomonas sp. TaxID=42353 RepID=UPI002081A46A|nr:hypothetical protein [Nitrosomonas sp.]GJL75565.1 MAG: putative aliphatic sulfonates-binding protein [Nitrosomonas sp.]